jgi:hypothetical protein
MRGAGSCLPTAKSASQVMDEQIVQLRGPQKTCPCPAWVFDVARFALL